MEFLLKYAHFTNAEGNPSYEAVGSKFAESLMSCYEKSKYLLVYLNECQKYTSGHFRKPHSRDKWRDFSTRQVFH